MKKELAFLSWFILTPVIIGSLCEISFASGYRWVNINPNVNSKENKFLTSIYDSPSLEHPFVARDYVGLSDEACECDYTGEGITVAVLDTGVNSNHTVFTDNGTSDWKDRIRAFYDVSEEKEIDVPFDISWHGTWATSILGGNSTDYQGIAPEVNLVIVKAFDYIDGDLTSTIPMMENAVDWILDNKDRYDIEIVSMSFGLKPDSENQNELKELQDIAERLVEEDILVVAASGNYGDIDSGEGDGSITSPASSKSVLAVGGVSYDGEMFESSGTGPSFEGAIKPDVCAPAIDVYGARSSGAIDDFESHTGTSASTPFVAGLASLLLEKSEDLSAQELKSLICLTSWRTINPNVIKDNLQGWGIIQGYAALDALENPETIDENVKFQFSLDEITSVFCQPISSKLGQYFFELVSLDGAEAELYLFDGEPDEYGNPVLLSSSINPISIPGDPNTVGLFTLESHNYYLVAKLVVGSERGDFLIKLTVDYRLGLVVALTAINIVVVLFAIKQYISFKQNRR